MSQGEAVNQGENRFYQFNFNECNIDSINAIIKDYDTIYVTYYYLGNSENDVPITSYANDEITIDITSGRKEFTEAEKTTDTHVAILPVGGTSLGDEPKSCFINGQEYKAIGWLEGDIIIPEKAFRDNGLSCQKLEVYLEQVLRSEESDDLVQKILSCGDGIALRTPSDMYEMEQNYANSVIAMMVAGFIVMMLVFRYLVKFIISESMSENIIYRIVGANTLKIAKVLSLDIFVTNLSLAVLTCSLHRILYTILFDKLNYYSNTSLHLKDYFFIMLVTSIVSLAALVPHLIKVSKKTVIQVRQEV